MFDESFPRISSQPSRSIDLFLFEAASGGGARLVYVARNATAVIRMNKKKKRKTRCFRNSIIFCAVVLPFHVAFISEMAANAIWGSFVRDVGAFCGFVRTGLW